MAPAQMEEAIQRRRLQLQQRQERQQQRDRGAGHLLPAQPYNEELDPIQVGQQHGQQRRGSSAPPLRFAPPSTAAEHRRHAPQPHTAAAACPPISAAPQPATTAAPTINPQRELTRPPAPDQVPAPDGDARAGVPAHTGRRHRRRRGDNVDEK